MSLECQASKQLVNELARSLGEDRVIEILQVTPARFKSLSQGRGRLADAQLLDITKQTGKFWMLWGVDASGRSAATAGDRDFISFSRRMVQRIDPVRGKSNGHSPTTGSRKNQHPPGKQSLRRFAEQFDTPRKLSAL